jgi:hypothetical protein
MSRLIALAFTLSLLAGQAQAQPEFRLEGFGAPDFGKTFAFIDARSPDGKLPVFRGPDFRLLEDGAATSAAVRQLAFRDTGSGLALIVAIDASRSMAGQPLDAIKAGLSGLMSRKRANDRVTVLTFANDIRFETRWDADSATTQRAFDNLKTRGDRTRLYDAIGQAMDDLDARAREDANFPARASILVFSDGDDEGSRAGFGQIVSRLQASHIRLDTAGLAHSPAGQQNLKVLAKAGFGGFRAAASADELTGIMYRGMEALLDSPVLEFNTERITSDGKVHEFGIEYLPSHWRDRFSLKLGSPAWYSDFKMWAGIAAAAVLLIGVWLLFSARRPAAIPASPSPPPVVPARSQRPETVLEAHPRAAASRVVTTFEGQTFEPPTSEPRVASLSPPKRLRALTEFARPESGNAPAWTLSAESGPYVGQRFALTPDETWIGSSPDNDLILSADPAVSGSHACIRFESGYLRLYDNQSLNNTFVNGRAIGHEVVVLRPGDGIRVGQSDFRVQPRS